MTAERKTVAPERGAAVAAVAADAATADPPAEAVWTLFHGVRMTKRLKTHVLMAPDGEPALYARTLDEVLFYLYDRDVMAFAVVEGRRQWQLRIAGPPGAPPQRTELDYG